MRYDVVLVPFPFDDLSGQKVRPAVCLTDALGVHRHVVIAFVSSVLPNAPEPSDVLLTPAQPEFAGTGLRVARSCGFIASSRYRRRSFAVGSARLRRASRVRFRGVCKRCSPSKSG